MARQHGPRPTWPLVVLAAVVGGAATAASTGSVAADPERASPYRNLGTFARALAHVEASWVENPDQDRLVYGAIDGMAATLDPHSEFLDPDEYRLLTSDTEGRFGGVGIEIEARDGWLTVLSAFPGAPADRAGVRPGDRFLVIDGRDARDLRIGDAVRVMRGEPGTQVTVRLRRPGVDEAVELTLVREIIRVDAVHARLLPDRVAYVKIDVFQATTTRELRRALDLAVTEAAPRGGLRGVLLDLRNNGGGLLDEAVLVSDEFLDEGAIVSVRGRDGALVGEMGATRAGTRPEWPIVVIVNGLTASAAEIVAGALHDHGRAVLVGTRTWGKGSVQNIIELPDASALKLTVARYYTPSGRSIQAQGIEPDVLVEQLDASAVAGATVRETIHESDLPRHLGAGDAQGRVGPEPGRRDVRPAPDTDGASAAAFPDDFQARMAHQTLRAILASHGM